MAADRTRRNCRTDHAEKISETLTGRAGLSPLAAYRSSLKIPGLLAEHLNPLFEASTATG